MGTGGMRDAILEKKAFSNLYFIYLSTLQLDLQLVEGIINKTQVPCKDQPNQINLLRNS